MAPPAPLIATTLFADYGTGYAIAIFIAACAVVSLVSAVRPPNVIPQGAPALGLSVT